MDETPGFDASQLQALVLDEADRILDMVNLLQSTLHEGCSFKLCHALGPAATVAFHVQLLPVIAAAFQPDVQPHHAIRCQSTTSTLKWLDSCPRRVCQHYKVGAISAPAGLLSVCECHP